MVIWTGRLAAFTDNTYAWRSMAQQTATPRFLSGFPCAPPSPSPPEASAFHTNAMQDNKNGWAEVPALPPFNFIDVLRQQQMMLSKLIYWSSSTSSSTTTNGVYAYLHVDLTHSKGPSLMHDKRELSLPFSVSQSLLDPRVASEQQKLCDSEAADTPATSQATTSAPGCLFMLEDLYLCEPCGKVLSPLDVFDEVECHICPGCLDVLPPGEASACGLRCGKCFTCPRCLHTLSLARRRKDEEGRGHLGASPLDGAAGAAAAFPFAQPEDEVEDPAVLAARFDSAAAAAEVAARAAAAAASDCDRTLETQAAGGGEAAAAAAAREGERFVIAACEGDAGEVTEQLEEAGCFASFVAPQRCDSLLSVPSLDGDAADDAEGATAGGEDPIPAPARAAYCSRAHLYFYSCAHCSWTSEAADIASSIPAVLPLLASQHQREGLGVIVFEELMEVLQHNAFEKERRRQLQQTVKSHAVAALIAAAANPHSREPAALPVTAAAAAAAAPWRLKDAQETEAQGEKQLREMNIWTYRRPSRWAFAPPQVPLAAIAEGQHLQCSVKNTLAAAAAAAERVRAEDAKEAAAEDASATYSLSAAEDMRRYPAYTEPLHAEQLLIDTGHPDITPVYSTSRVFTAARCLRMHDRVGLQELLQAPEAFAAAAAGSSFLPLKRRLLLPRCTKRCCDCERIIVKPQLSPEAVPPFRINHSAALLLPSIDCRVVGDVGHLLQGEKGVVLLALTSCADSPVTVTLISATKGYMQRGKQLPQKQQLQGGETEGQAGKRDAWWNLDWNGSLTVELGAYDELLDELGGAQGEASEKPPDGLDEALTGTGDAVLAQWGNSALLRLEVSVHPNCSDTVAVLPFAAEIFSGKKDSAPIFRLQYVGIMGTGARQAASSSVKRTETI
ncbi:uncharacterized protein LOC34619046 [Cyclospora cayetanensis]|uniref:Dynactin subunit 4 n=1 Tax=Cyclospora cayetanensis TaxID=88456 RepID=A0A6P6S1L6_9EIME|nr:uncharacterized protein LOC34619046 [Cyclospora cayetanensis]